MPRYACPHPSTRCGGGEAGPDDHPSAVSLTPMTLAPGSASNLFNAVVTRTPSLL